MLKRSAQEFEDKVSQDQHSHAKIFIWLLLLLSSLWPELVFADTAGTLGDIICNSKDEATYLPNLLAAICFVSGAVVALRGLLLLKKHSDNPNDSQLSKVIAHFVAAGCLLSLPAFAGVIQKTLFSDIAGQEGAFNCTASSVTGDGTQGLDIMMQNFVKNIHDPIMTLVALISVLVGLTYIVRALHNMAKSGTGARGTDPKSIITHLVIGGILISTATSFRSVMSSLFGTGTSVTDMFTYTGLAWNKLSSSEGAVKNVQDSVDAVLAFIQILGIIAFVRGWMVLKAALDGGQATIPQGVIFVVAGVMAVNIDKMIEIFNKTFGTNIINN